MTVASSQKKPRKLEWFHQEKIQHGVQRGTGVERYPLVMTNIAMERSTMLSIGKPSTNGPWLPWLC